MITSLFRLSCHRLRRFQLSMSNNNTPTPVRLVYSTSNITSTSNNNNNNNNVELLPCPSEPSSQSESVSASESEDRRRKLEKKPNRRKRKHGFVHSSVNVSSSPARANTPLSPPSTPPPCGNMLVAPFQSKRIIGLAAVGYDSKRKVLNLILLRHAESQNNVLADELTKQFGVSPHIPQSASSTSYAQKRNVDPELSAWGRQQVSQLSSHPYLRHIGLRQLAAQRRVLLFTSPMRRAMQTSQWLAKGLNMKVKVWPDLCERGGLFVGSKRLPGPSRSMLESEFGETHDSNAVGEEGWWEAAGEGAETDQEFEQRIREVEMWLRRHLARRNGLIVKSSSSSSSSTENKRSQQQQPQPRGKIAKRAASATITSSSSSSSSSSATATAAASGSSSPEYLVITSHADFLNALLSHLLGMQDPYGSTYSFVHDTTGITHCELSFAGDIENPRTDKLQVRIRAMNMHGGLKT